DQDGVDPDPLQFVERGAFGYAALGDDRLPSGDVGHQLEGRLDVDAEVIQIAVVDADHVGVDGQGGLELRFVVDLHDDVEVETTRLLVEAGEEISADGGHDQEHGVRAGPRGPLGVVAGGAGV